MFVKGKQYTVRIVVLFAIRMHKYKLLISFLQHFYTFHSHKYLSMLPDVYRQIISTIFASPYAYHCREIRLKNHSQNIQSGVWKITPPQQRRALVSLQQILIMIGYE